MGSIRVSLLVLAIGFVATGLAGAAPVEAAMTTEEVLDSWAEALGGKERLSQSNVVKRVYDAKLFNMDGTLEIWASSEGKTHIFVEVPGVFRVVQVYDGEKGWTLNQNGVLNEDSGETLADRVNNAYLSSYSHLIEGRMRGEVEYLGAEEETGLHRVRCLPIGGEEVTFYLDPSTYLPVKSISPANDQTLTLEYSDWTEYEGIREAATFKQSMGDEKFDASFAMRSVEYMDAAPAGIFVRPAEASSASGFTASGSSVELDMEMNGQHVFVPVSVNGSEPLWFIFDTGAGVTCLEMETAKELGVQMKGEIQARGAGEGSVTARFVSGVTLDMGGVELETEQVVALPFGMLEPKFGRRVDGILGYDYISQYVITIDYANEKIRIHDPETFEYAGSGTSVPIRIENGHPHLTAKLTPLGRDPIEAEFMVDTGAGGALGFARPFIEKHDLLATLPKKMLFTGTGGVGGQSSSYVGRIESFELAGYEIESPICGFSQDQSGAGADRHNAGLLGGRILERFTVTIDYPGKQMIFEPQDDYKRAFRQNWSGISFEAGGRGDWHSFRVWDVMPDSPGGKAGIAVGDELVSIDGRPASEFTVATLRDYLMDRQGSTMLVCRREGKEFEREIPLEPYF